MAIEAGNGNDRAEIGSVCLQVLRYTAKPTALAAMRVPPAPSNTLS